MPFSGQRELSNFSYFETRFFKICGDEKITGARPFDNLFKILVANSRFFHRRGLDKKYTGPAQSLPFGNIRYLKVSAYANFLGQVNNNGNLKKGVDIIVAFREKIPNEYHGITDPVINAELKDLLVKKRTKGLPEQADYIKSKILMGKS